MGPAFVHPDRVDAMKRDLHRAMGALHVELGGDSRSTPREREIAALIGDWNHWLAHPTDWLTAPDVLEMGRDIEARIATLQGPPPDRGLLTGPHPHRAGEVLGMHTVGEMSDLRDALAYEVGQLTAAYNACADSWKAADAATNDAWKADFDAALAQFGRAYDQVQAILNAPLALMAFPYIGVEDAWNALTATIHAFTDLDRRLRVAGVCTPPDYKDMPQPQHSDLDLKVYNFSGSVLKGVQKGAQAVGGAVQSTVPWVVVGGCLLLGIVVALRR